MFIAWFSAFQKKIVTKGGGEGAGGGNEFLS